MAVDTRILLDIAVVIPWHRVNRNTERREGIPNGDETFWTSRVREVADNQAEVHEPVRRHLRDHATKKRIALGRCVVEIVDDNETKGVRAGAQDALRRSTMRLPGAAQVASSQTAVR